MDTKTTSRRKRKADRHPYEHYPTPKIVPLWIFKHLIHPTGDTYTMIDPGCGFGPFGWAAREIWGDQITRIGVELCRDFRPESGLYHEVIYDDYLRWSTNNPARQVDLICGNPWYENVNYMIQPSLNLLKPGGILALLLPLEWLGGKWRARHIFRGHTPLERVYISINRLNFKGDEGSSDLRWHALYWWRKGALVDDPAIMWFDYKDGSVDDPGTESLPDFQQQLSLPGV